jgi:hypothetical protein
VSRIWILSVLLRYIEMEIQHFCHDEHPLVFNEDERSRRRCWGCYETVLGPSYSCIQCKDFYHHKSCAELPHELHHPLHPKHPLILFEEWKYFYNKEYSKCEVCKKYIGQYSYGCSDCNFNLHNRCASLPLTMETGVHDHPLTCLWKLVKFTCDLCGKVGNVAPYQCASRHFWIHKSCGSCLRRVKVIRHKHPLNLIHSLEVNQSISRFCQLCVQKVDTDYGLYYCSICDFVVHLDCAMYERNREELKDEEFENEDSELDEAVDLETYKVKKIILGEDGTEIATEIEHFTHEHDLKLIDEVLNNEKCNGCARAILPPFYSCSKCSFFLHKSCVELSRKIERHPLHRHAVILLANQPSKTFWCDACGQICNGFTYRCEKCDFDLDVQCSLNLDIVIHEGHEHRLILSNTPYKQKCNCCDNERYQVFRCTTCEFALDFKCATLPLSTRYKQHDHPFKLCYTPEDDSGEYYCDICEEERDPQHWYYYCAKCNYLAHPECILGKYPNYKFGGAYTFDCHEHPLTFIEKTKDHPPCDKCHQPCTELIHQCVQCNFNMHPYCL